MTDHPDTCKCCARKTDRTPGLVENRPGLAAIEYRVGTHPDFLASMIGDLNDPQRPTLGRLSTRDSDDFTMALLDAWAVTGDVLTFYNERLANESYLRTARERLSLQELGQLIGYQLRPGAAAETYLAFAVESAPEIPAAIASEPGSAPAVVPAEITLGERLRIQSIPGPDEKPQTFETVEEIVARPEWNAIPASTTLPSTPVFGDTVTWLAGASVNVKAGDILLLAGTDIVGERWDVRTITEVVRDQDNDRTEIRWTTGLGSQDPFKNPATDPRAYILRKRVGVFGANAPSWDAMSAEFKTEYPGTGSEWPNFRITPSTTASAVDLDGSHPDVVVGSYVVLAKGNNRELFVVSNVEELSRAEFATSGKVTRATLVQGENFASFDDEPRETVVFAVSEEVELTRAPDLSDVDNDSVTVDLDTEGLIEGRTLLLTGETTAGDSQTEIVSLAAATLGDPSTLTLEEPLQHTYVRDTVIIHANVALATHGETVDEVLGSGDATSPFQSFGLAHEPLTYVQSTDPSGVATSLEVRVNDVLWSEEPTAFASESDERIYVVRTDPDEVTTVRFGDGAQGSRLPSGSLNVRARYRKGLGREGNVGVNALSQLIDRPLGAKGVTNPLAAAGGVDPEAETEARTSMPLNVRTLGRAVSLLDFADFARAFTGVVKAKATVLPIVGVRTIVVTVAFDPTSGSETSERLATLRGALRQYGDPNVEVEVVDYRPQPFRLALKVAVDPLYESAPVLDQVETALQTTFGFDQRGLEEPLHLSEIVAAAHTVAGVDAVDIDSLYLGVAGGLNNRLLPLRPAVTSTGAALGVGLISIDVLPFDSIGELL